MSEIDKAGRVIVYLPLPGFTHYTIEEMQQLSTLELELLLNVIFEEECTAIQDGDHWTASGFREIAYQIEWIRYKRESGLTTINHN